MTKKPQVVIFALIKSGKILVEKRPVPGFLKDQYLIPGGATKAEENLEQALKREVMEELGVIPIEFEPLKEGYVLGLYGNILQPFVVTAWEGKIPKISLDKEDQYPLEWIEIETALDIPIESTRIIVEALKKYYDTSKT